MYSQLANRRGEGNTAKTCWVSYPERKAYSVTDVIELEVLVLLITSNQYLSIVNMTSRNSHALPFPAGRSPTLYKSVSWWANTLDMINFLPTVTYFVKIYRNLPCRLTAFTLTPVLTYLILPVFVRHFIISHTILLVIWKKNHFCRKYWHFNNIYCISRSLQKRHSRIFCVFQFWQSSKKTLMKC